VGFREVVPPLSLHIQAGKGVVEAILQGQTLSIANMRELKEMWSHCEGRYAHLTTQRGFGRSVGLEQTNWSLLKGSIPVLCKYGWLVGPMRS
jgi:hypothetical protein